MLNQKTENTVYISNQLLYLFLYLFFIVSSMIFMFTMKEMILILIIVYFFSIIVYIKYKKIKFENLEKWIKIDARVINIKVIKCICFSAFKVRANKNEVYKPYILYKYKYNGREIISNQYAISYDDVDCNFNYSEVKAQKKINEIKRNKDIKIFVNQDTGESVVTLNTAKGYGIPYMGIIISSFMMLLLVYKLYYA